MKEIKVNSEVVATSEYDVLGRQTKLIDVNAGTIEYKYNAYGDVTETTNANGEVKTYTYDDFGRLVQTNNNGIIVDYEYVETGNGINEIEKISTLDHEQTFEYDGLNRVVKTTEVISGESFEFEFEYNNLNQVKKLTYPNGLEVNNVYDNNDNGYLVEVQDHSGDILWKGDKQDAYGRFVEYTKGDGVSTELIFDDFQNLEEIIAGNVQHHEYNWNTETGNLTNRKDFINEVEESFLYDNLNRLERSAASPIGATFTYLPVEVNYESNGNIKDKTDAGDYEYHPTKPNAVTNVTNDNENISLLTQDISYNALNKASSIVEGDYNLEFLYGHDKQRRKTTFYDNGLAMEKYFVGLYEKEIDHQTGITRHINYITAGDGMTAIVLQEEDNGTTTEETYFTYKDHLGSIVALTDDNGDVVLEQSIDACSVTLKLDDDNQSNFLVEPIPRSEQANREGRYRNPDNWSSSDVPDSPTWLRGYTGHCLSRCIFSRFSYEIENSSKITIGEHLPHFDLINMNGRVYDPILGRMLSPDRFVPDPLSTQGYNRYSYVFNNPLRYSDPSGDLPVVAGVIIGAVVGGYVGDAVQSQNFNPFTAEYWEDGWQGFIGGAIIGGFTGGAAAKAGLPVDQGNFLGMSKTGAKNFSSSMVSGVQNTLYQYNPDDGFGWHSLGHFAVGVGGSYAGIGGGSTAAAFFVGGTGNVVVNSIYYNAVGKDYEAYDMMQWFIGGGLTAYNGAKGAGMGNWKNEEYIFGRWEDYAIDKGIQSLASDFAYDDYQNFFDKPLSHHFMTFSRGAMGAGLEAVAGYNHVFEAGRDANVGQNGRQLWGMLLYSGAYSLEYAMYGLQEAQGNNVGFYTGGSYQKVGVYSHKMLFYTLGMK